MNISETIMGRRAGNDGGKETLGHGVVVSVDFCIVLNLLRRNIVCILPLVLFEQTHGKIVSGPSILPALKDVLFPAGVEVMRSKQCTNPLGLCPRNPGESCRHYRI